MADPNKYRMMDDQVDPTDPTTISALGQSRYKIIDDDGPVLQPKQESFLDKLKNDLTAPKEDQSVGMAQLKGFGAGAIEGIQNINRYIPAIIRSGTGMMSAEGSLPGAAISGAGEAAAELWEDPTHLPSPARIGASAAVGAVPFGAVMKAGRPLASAARGALYAGGGEALKQYAAEGKVDPWETAKAAATGALFTGGLAKLLGKAAPPADVAPPQEPYIVEPTAQTGEGTQTIVSSGKGGSVKTIPSVRPKPINPEGGNIDVVPPTSAPPPPSPDAAGIAPEPSTPYSTAAPRPYRPAAKAAQAEEDAATQAAKAANEAEAMREGLVPDEPVVTDTFSYDNPYGGKTVGRQTYRVPDQKGGTIGGKSTSSGSTPPKPPTPPSSGGNPIPELSTAPPAPPAPPVVEPPAPVIEPTSQTAVIPGQEPPVPTPNSYSPPMSATDAEVRDAVDKLKKLLGLSDADVEAAVRMGQGEPPKVTINPEPPAPTVAAPEPPPVSAAPAKPTPADLFDTHPEVMEEANRLGEAYRNGDKSAGKALAELRDFMTPGKMREGWRGAPELGPSPAPEAPDWVQHQSGIVDKLKALAKGEEGSAELPSIPGMNPETGLHEMNAGIPLKGEEIKSFLTRAFEKLPQIQRFNYLFDLKSLPANAFVGPYGSAMMGAIEKMLSGDARGQAALKELNPRAFYDDFRKSFVEARSLVGRAEGQPMNAATSQFDRAMAAPGVWMTAGDVAARNALLRAGFTEQEARMMTLTSEPELPSFKKLADLGKTAKGKSATLLELLFPFKRTPANILEQGLYRMPGIGSLAQSFREAPDPIKTQIWQQLLGAGVGVGNELLAESLDPETAKLVKRYTTNFSGQYGLPASIGFSIGQARREGKSWQSGFQKEAGFAVPLPSSKPITEWARFLSGNARRPDGSIAFPSGSYPKALEMLDGINLGLPKFGPGSEEDETTIPQNKYRILE